MLKNWTLADSIYWFVIVLTAIIIIPCIGALVAWGQTTVGVPSGCFQRVYVHDPATGKVRKLEREEVGFEAKGPGTGRWGSWEEHDVEKPGAGFYTIRRHLITDKEVKRILGRDVFEWFGEQKVRVSQTYNLTDQPFSIIGWEGKLPRGINVPANLPKVNVRLYPTTTTN